MSRAAAAVAMHPPRVFSIVLCTGANTVPVHIPPLMRRVSHRIQSSGGGWPYPLPCMSGLVWSNLCLFMSGPVQSVHVWSRVWSDLVRPGPIRSAPLRSTHVMSAPLVLWLSSDSVVPRRCAKAISPISLAQSIVYNKLSTI